MPRLRQAVAQQVADRLFAVESAIDLALTRAAELNAAMPQARTEARLPAMVGQTALDRAAEAFTALVEARRRIVATHASLDETRLQIGLKEVATGDSMPKDPFTEASAGEAPRGSAIRSRSRRMASSRAMFSGEDTMYRRIVRRSYVVVNSSTWTRSFAASAMASSVRSCAAYCVFCSPIGYPSSDSGFGMPGRYGPRS